MNAARKCRRWYAGGRRFPVFTGFVAVMVALAYVSSVSAQTSSIRLRRAKHAESKPVTHHGNPRFPEVRRGNPTLERHSLAAVKVKPPKQFVVHDLITIIIREQRKYESDAELETKKKFDITSAVNAFFKIDDGLLGASVFPNGKPNIGLKISTKLKNESDKDREDRFTTRITAEIVDIKPNGNLVLEAKARVAFDDEVSIVTLTGVARKVDVTPDNTVLSTQLANKNIVVHNTGAVRDGSRRGWIPRFLDLVRPI